MVRYIVDSLENPKEAQIQSKIDERVKQGYRLVSTSGVPTKFRFDFWAHSGKGDADLGCKLFLFFEKEE